MKITEAEKVRLSIGLEIAWTRYRELFGVPPYGTDDQIRALVDLIPGEFIRAETRRGKKP